MQSNQLIQKFKDVGICSAVGIILGVCANTTSRILDKYTQPDYNKSPINYLYFSLVLKIIIIAILLVMVDFYFPNFSQHWQNTVPGLFFVSFFFGLQFNIFDHIKFIRHKILF